MRILVVSERYYPEGGGGNLATHLTLKKRLKEMHEIEVLTSTQKPEKIPGVIYHYLPISGTPPETKYHIWVRQLRIARSTWFRNYVAKFDAIYIPDHSWPFVLAAQRGQKVVIHLHDYQSVTPPSTIIATNKKYNELSLAVNSMIYELFHGRGNTKALLSLFFVPLNSVFSLLLAKASAVICVSQRQRSILAQSRPWIAGKMYVIPNPLPDDILLGKLIARRPSFVYLGSNNVMKGLGVVLEASTKMLCYGYDILVTLIGVLNKMVESDRWYASKFNWIAWIRRINSLTKNSSIMALPRLSRAKLPRLYHKSWATLVPTLLEEPAPYVVVESILAGRLPLASCVGGIPEMLSGTTASRFMFKTGNALNLSEKMAEVACMKPETVEALGLKIREEFISRYDEDLYSKKMQDVFFLH